MSSSALGVSLALKDENLGTDSLVSFTLSAFVFAGSLVLKDENFGTDSLASFSLSDMVLGVTTVQSARERDERFSHVQAIHEMQC